jgi:hypothetical protein
MQLRSNLKIFVPERAFELDSVGNARGGVRSLPVDVPTDRWVGAKSGSFRCMFYGYRFPLSREEMRGLYPTPAAYLEKVRARADALVAERWLTREDRDEILQRAQRSELLE